MSSPGYAYPRLQGGLGQLFVESMDRSRSCTLEYLDVSFRGEKRRVLGQGLGYDSLCPTSSGSDKEV